MQYIHTHAMCNAVRYRKGIAVATDPIQLQATAAATLLAGWEGEVAVIHSRIDRVPVVKSREIERTHIPGTPEN